MHLNSDSNAMEGSSQPSSSSRRDVMSTYKGHWAASLRRHDLVKVEASSSSLDLEVTESCRRRLFLQEYGASGKRSEHFETSDTDLDSKSLLNDFNESMSSLLLENERGHNRESSRNIFDHFDWSTGSFDQPPSVSARTLQTSNTSLIELPKEEEIAEDQRYYVTSRSRLPKQQTTRGTRGRSKKSKRVGRADSSRSVKRSSKSKNEGRVVGGKLAEGEKQVEGRKSRTRSDDVVDSKLTLSSNRRSKSTKRSKSSRRTRREKSKSSSRNEVARPKPARLLPRKVERNAMAA